MKKCMVLLMPRPLNSEPTVRKSFAFNAKLAEAINKFRHAHLISSEVKAYEVVLLKGLEVIESQEQQP